LKSIGLEHISQFNALLIHHSSDLFDCVCFFHPGSADRVVPLLASQIVNHHATGCADRDLKIYDGAFHELFEDTIDRQRYLDDIVGFVDRVTPQAVVAAAQQ
jgi:alpha-beta hydrolase superfamily lysophospholipase